MTGLNFEKMAEKELIKDLQKLEKDFGKLPEIGFKIYKKKEKNYVEKLIEELK